MTKEELLEYVTDNMMWDVPTAGIWMSPNGRLMIPWTSEDDPEEMLLEVRDWLETDAEADDVLYDMSGPDRLWLYEKVTRMFADLYRSHLNLQLDRLEILNDSLE